MPSPVALPDRPRWRRRRGRRPSPRHDATPFVDLAFVLLAAYVLVLLIGQPAKLEVNLPEQDTSTTSDLAEHPVNYLRATRDGAFWWGSDQERPQQVSLTGVRQELRAQGRYPHRITIVQVERGAPYRALMDLLDELDQLNVRTYAIGKMRPRDLALIAEARAAR